MADKVLATMTDKKQRLLGKNCIVYLNYGESATEATPKWTAIGGQTKGNLEMSADSIDGSNKDSGGWGEEYAGTKSTELSVEGYVTKDDEAYNALKDAFINGAAVDICRFFTDSGTADRNWYHITKLSDETPHDDMVSFSLTLGGVGAPKFYKGLSTVDGVKDTAATPPTQSSGNSAGSEGKGA